MSGAAKARDGSARARAVNRRRRCCLGLAPDALEEAPEDQPVEGQDRVPIGEAQEPFGLEPSLLARCDRPLASIGSIRNSSDAWPGASSRRGFEAVLEVIAVTRQKSSASPKRTAVGSRRPRPSPGPPARRSRAPPLATGGPRRTSRPPPSRQTARKTAAGVASISVSRQSAKTRPPAQSGSPGMAPASLQRVSRSRSTSFPSAARTASRTSKTARHQPSRLAVAEDHGVAQPLGQRTGDGGGKRRHRSGSRASSVSG